MTDPAVGRPLLEACVTTAEEAVAAVAGGAHRLELCRELETGGLSPGPTLLATVLDALAEAGRDPVPVFCMVRPEPGPFLARRGIVARMRTEILQLTSGGASGLVLGLLEQDGGLDRVALGALMEAAGDLPVTFHRAFDALPDPLRSLEALAELGVRRVLTGGGAGTAWEGRETLRRLVEVSANRPGLPEILGAGGIRDDHVLRLLGATGLREIHARAAAFPALAQAIAFAGAGE